jgi:hypothetical protein
MSFFFLLYLVGSLPTLVFYLIPSLAMAAAAAAAAIAKFTSWIIFEFEHPPFCLSYHKWWSSSPTQNKIFVHLEMIVFFSIHEPNC